MVRLSDRPFSWVVFFVIAFVTLGVSYLHSVFGLVWWTGAIVPLPAIVYHQYNYNNFTKWRRHRK